MRLAVDRTLIKLMGGLAVVVVSFWTTTEIVYYWSTPRDLNANVIHITEATYGKSCQSFVPAPGHANLVKPGNATAAASQTCDNTNVICPLFVDRIGDPAPGCDKDFMVRWRCDADQTVHQIYLPAEGAEIIAWVSCQAQ
jgi:hypothetical protein